MGRIWMTNLACLVFSNLWVATIWSRYDRYDKLRSWLGSFRWFTIQSDTERTDLLAEVCAPILATCESYKALCDVLFLRGELKFFCLFWQSLCTKAVVSSLHCVRCIHLFCKQVKEWCNIFLIKYFFFQTKLFAGSMVMIF